MHGPFDKPDGGAQIFSLDDPLNNIAYLSGPDFRPFDFEPTPYGYIVKFQNDDSTGFGDALFSVHPNNIITPAAPCLIVDHDGKRATRAMYLACLAPDRSGVRQICLAYIDPLRVFTVPLDDAHVLHAVRFSDDIDRQAYDAAWRLAVRAGLTNLVASFSIGQSWRPWQGIAN